MNDVSNTNFSVHFSDMDQGPGISVLHTNNKVLFELRKQYALLNHREREKARVESEAKEITLLRETIAAMGEEPVR